MAKLSNILDQIDTGTILLPEFQRGYVWNRDQVRGLMRSLYLGHPVGGLLLWETSAADLSVRGGLAGTGTHLLLLDGQQRITSLYGVTQGKEPAFFEGDGTAFSGLYFNVEDEKFEFYKPTIMAGDFRWVNVTDLFTQGLRPLIKRINEHAPDALPTYMERLGRLREIVERDFHAETITGADKSVDEVVDIFNRVNSGGTKLSKGDLALAKLCAQWPDARSVMRRKLASWQDSRFDFSLEWLLRNATAVATGRAQFRALDGVTAAEFEDALERSTEYVNTFLNAISGRLGLDHDRVLMGRYAIPVVSRLLALNGGQFDNHAHRDKVLFWYVHAALWGRFAGSTETYLQQDYDHLREGGLDGLLGALERWRGGNLEVQPHDFEGSTRGSRFYPLLYMLTRVKGARDLGSGLELKAETLGKLSSLQVHHIFPKALLYERGYERSLVNAVANFCFLTQDTNLAVGKREPADYFAEAEARHPGVLASQWIPTDPELWRIENYWNFLAERRRLLAAAAQEFLIELRSGADPHDGAALEPMRVVSEETDDPRTAQVHELIDELVRIGFARPETDAEIADPVSGRTLAQAEAYWPDGLQPGQGNPVVLDLDPNEAERPRIEELGFDLFDSVDALLGFANRRNEEAAGGAEEVPPEAATAPSPTDIEAEFGRRMRDIYERARKEAHYTASYFLSMLAELGPLATARRLLNSPAVSDGFAALWERGRLDLTVEALVLDPQFADLFDEEELAAARHRLKQFGYEVGAG